MLQLQLAPLSSSASTCLQSNNSRAMIVCFLVIKCGALSLFSFSCCIISFTFKRLGKLNTKINYTQIRMAEQISAQQQDWLYGTRSVSMPVTISKLTVMRTKIFYGKTQSKCIHIIMNSVKRTSFQWTYLLLPPAVGETQRRYPDSIVQPRMCMFWPQHRTRHYVYTLRSPGITENILGQCFWRGLENVSWYLAHLVLKRPVRCLKNILGKCFSTCLENTEQGGADVVGWGTAIQAGRLRVRFPMVSLESFIDIILSVALWPWGRLSL
jgi:hypothetical protein